MKKPALKPAFLAPAGFLEGTLGKDDQDQLARDLADILPQGAEKLATFVARVDEALSGYRNLFKPTHDAKGPVAECWSEIGKLARQIDAEILRLDPGDRMVLEREIWITLRKRGLNDGDDLVLTSPSIFDETVTRFLRKRRGTVVKRPNARSKEPFDPPAARFASEIAIAYQDVYGKKPTFATEGIFAKALRAIVKIAQIPMPGHTRLRSIIEP